MMNQPLYTLREASEMSGIELPKLRNLCNTGLIPGIRRNRKCFRVLSEEQINLAKTLIRMREAGFTPRDLRKYVRLYRQGAKTKAERKAMLKTRKRQIWQEIEVKQKSIDFIERQEELLS